MYRRRKRTDVEAGRPVHLGVICVDVGELLKAHEQGSQKKYEKVTLHNGAYHIVDAVSPRDVVVSTKSPLGNSLARASEKKSKKSCSSSRNASCERSKVKGGSRSTIRKRGDSRERPPASLRRVVQSDMDTTPVESGNGGVPAEEGDSMTILRDVSGPEPSSVSGWHGVGCRSSPVSGANRGNSVPPLLSLSMLSVERQDAALEYPTELDKKQPAEPSMPPPNTAACTRTPAMCSLQSFAGDRMRANSGSVRRVVGCDMNERDRGCSSSSTTTRRRNDDNDIIRGSISPSPIIGTLGAATMPSVSTSWGAPPLQRAAPSKRYPKNLSKTSSLPHRLLDTSGRERVILTGVLTRLPKPVVTRAFPAPRPRVTTRMAATVASLPGGGAENKMLPGFRGGVRSGMVPSNRPKRF